MQLKSKWILSLIAIVLLIGFCLSFHKNINSIQEIFMYPIWNQYFQYVSLGLFTASMPFLLFAKPKIGCVVLLGSIAFGQFAMQPYHEVDQLFYQQISLIENQIDDVSLSEKIELCENVKSTYLNLKKQMIIKLEQTCSKAVLQLSDRSLQELNQAFNWAYSEYARKPQYVQAVALACLYAETNQKEFALELSEKHLIEDLKAKLKTSGRCRSSKNRQVASVEP